MYSQLRDGQIFVTHEPGWEQRLCQRIRPLSRIIDQDLLRNIPDSCAEFRKPERSAELIDQSMGTGRTSVDVLDRLSSIQKSRGSVAGLGSAGQLDKKTSVS